LASRILCNCGETLRINLYEGHGLKLLVSEELTDIPNDSSCGQLLDSLVVKSPVVVICKNCGVLSIIEKNLNITRYAPVDTFSTDGTIGA
jgi:hypothetical protein